MKTNCKKAAVWDPGRIVLSQNEVTEYTSGYVYWYVFYFM